MADARPIGVFDSGVGGLTVLREIVRRLPNESTIYLGDNARTPYGPRPDDEVRRFSFECLDVLAAQDVKAIVAYLRTVPPVYNKVPAPHDSALPVHLWGKFQMLILGKDLPSYLYAGNAGVTKAGQR